MHHAENDYWFPAKTYGWGWGFPVRWQGWVVLGTWAALLTIASIATLVPTPNWVLFGLVIALLAAALMVVCFLKGEPPRWRWG